MDQRGVSRPQGTACDLGAFERDVLPITPTLTISQTGSLLQLQWSTDPVSCDYEVYESSTPYSGFTLLAIVTAENSYEPALDPTESRYFYVHADCQDSSGVTNTVGIFRFSLTPGD